ncbi:MAG: hypothetical protein WCL44_05505 [bacterium]
MMMKHKASRKPMQRVCSPEAGHAGSGGITTIRRVRGIIRRTQAELASALGVSVKAVQSYEQGWRTVPPRVMIQLLVLLALYRRQTVAEVPCWKIHKCAPVHRNVCPGFTVGGGQFCWMIGARACPSGSGGSGWGVVKCLRCSVVKRLMSGRQGGARDPRASRKAR